MSALWADTPVRPYVVATGVTYTNAIARLLLEGNRVLVDRFELTDDGRDQLVAIGSIGIERLSVGTGQAPRQRRCTRQIVRGASHSATMPSCKLGQ